MTGETGRVEVMQIEGFTGSDVAAHASMPNLGIISVRYPVTGLSIFLVMLENRGVRIEYAANGMKIAGIGTVNILAVRDPDGSITEFYERTGE